MNVVSYKGAALVTAEDEQTLRSFVSEVNETSRYCYHQSPDSELHVMLIGMPEDKEYPAHRHNDSDESITITQGDLYISLHDVDGSLLNTYHLSPGANISLLIKKQQWHSVKSGENGASFLEVKRGPFDKSQMEYYPSQGGTGSA